MTPTHEWLHSSPALRTDQVFAALTLERRNFPFSHLYPTPLTNALRQGVPVQHQELHCGDGHAELGDGGLDADIDGREGEFQLSPAQGFLGALGKWEDVEV